jgi:transposase
MPATTSSTCSNSNYVGRTRSANSSSFLSDRALPASSARSSWRQREVFRIHRLYLESEHTLAWLQEQLSPVQERIRALLEQGTRSRHEKTANFCQGLLEEWPALWTFCEVPDIPLTNNAAERALRHAVIMRKVQGGTQSEHGDHWIERILSVTETCRLQGRSKLAYLIEAATAAHHGRAAPSPLPSPP